MLGYSLEQIKRFWEKHTINGVPKVTERQHYVPVHYLKAWRTGRRIAAKIGNNPPKLISVRDAAVKSWCYEFVPLSLVELETIIDCAEPQFEYERIMLSKLLAIGVIPQLAGRLVNNRNDGEAELMLRTIKSRGLFIPEAENLFNVRYMATCIRPKLANEGYELHRKEGAERIITGIENSALPYLKMVKDGHCGFLRDAKTGIHLIGYVFLQMFRTPKLDAVLCSATNTTETPSNYAEHMVPYLRFIFAIKTICQSVANWEEFEFKLIRNKTDCRFITGDYPFLHLDKNSFYEFLFPISPDMALYMGRKGNLMKLYSFLLSLDRNIVASINNEIQRSAVNQIFACTCKELELV